MRCSGWVVVLLAGSCDKGASPSPPPPGPVPTKVEVADAALVVPPQVETLCELSADGKRALLGSGRGRRAFRVVEVGTGKVLHEVAMPKAREALGDGAAIADLDRRLADPALHVEVRAAAKLIGQFPRRAAHGIAASPDGTYVAFEASDDVYVLASNNSVTRVGVLAARDPLYAPDGKALFIRRVTVDGNHTLWSTTPDGRTAPDMIAGTRHERGPLGIAAGGLRLAVPGGADATTFIEVPFAAPHDLTKLVFVRDQVPGDCVWSASGTKAGCAARSAQPGSGGAPQVRYRSFDLATHDVVVDVVDAGDHSALLAVGDDGTIVFGAGAMVAMRPGDKQPVGLYPGPVDPRVLVRGKEVVYSVDGRVAVVPIPGR